MADPLSGMHALIVEDNPANLMLIEAVLRRAGCRLSIASSAEEVPRQLDADAPDFILMDVQLPGQDGLALTRALKADPSTATIPIVALTAHAMKEDRERAFAAGCVGYIAKPINVRGFAEEIATILVGVTSNE